MKNFDMQAYRASTGRDLDKDGVFNDNKIPKGSSSSANKPKVHARDRIRMYRSMGKKQTDSASSGGISKEGTVKSPRRSRSPLRTMSVNSPKRYEKLSIQSPKQKSTISPKRSPALRQRVDVNMRNLLKGAAMKLQPHVSLSMSPLQPTSTFELSSSRGRGNTADGERSNHSGTSIIEATNDIVTTSQLQSEIVQIESLNSDEYQTFLDEMTREQHLRYKEVSKMNVFDKLF